MSNECVEDDGKQWDYMCPNFCDFNATETTDQLKEIDHFFEVDHELNDESTYGQKVVQTVSITPVIDSKSNLSANGSKDSNEVIDDFKYETPPQNKENFEDDDNEVFYSTKKYLSVERKYKLRSTPMRTLQYNGNTPLRETRISSKKKKKNMKSNSGLKRMEESMFAMQRLLMALPNQSDDTPLSETTETKLTETRINIEEEINTKTTADQQSEQIIDNKELEEIKDDVFESENVITNRRESYVIKKAPKSVVVVSPLKSSKKTQSVKKRVSNSARRRGTPRRSVMSSNRKVSTQSVVSRLYSTSKKTQNQYKSMAELLKEFETKTRDCSRSQSLDRDSNVPLGQRSRSSSVSSLTRPKSPKLHSIYRHRPTPRKTEDIIESNIKKYFPFKANPIRKKLFDANFASGIPRVKSSKAPTKAIPMSFMTEKRHELWATKHSTSDKPQEDHKFKANPMPAFNGPKVGPKSEKKGTTFRPFSFDDRIQQLVTKKRTQSEETIKRDIPRNNFRF